MTATTPPSGSRLTTRWRVVTVLGLVVAAALAHYGYGNRHNLLDLRIYTDAVRWWTGGRDLYDYGRPDPVMGSLGFPSPPFAAVVLAPLAWMPFNLVIAIYVTISGLSLVLVTYLVTAPLADRFSQPRWYVLGLALPLVSWLEPVRETFTFGQINVILVLLVVADLLVAVPRASRLAGVGIGLAAAIKLTPAIFIGYLLITRRWRPGLTAIATAVGATGLAAAVNWHGSWRFWTSELWDARRVGHLEHIPNQSLLGALARFAAPAPPNRLVWAVLVLVVLGFGLWRARRAALRGNELAGLTLAAFTGALVCPITWTHHLIWFIPALVLLIDAAADRAGTPARRRGLGGLAVAVYLTVTVSVIQWYDWEFVDSRYNHGVVGFLIDNSYILLMLVLLVVLPVDSSTRRVLPDRDLEGDRVLVELRGTQRHP